MIEHNNIMHIYTGKISCIHCILDGIALVSPHHDHHQHHHDHHQGLRGTGGTGAHKPGTCPRAWFQRSCTIIFNISIVFCISHSAYTHNMYVDAYTCMSIHKRYHPLIMIIISITMIIIKASAYTQNTHTPKSQIHETNL